MSVTGPHGRGEGDRSRQAGPGRAEQASHCGANQRIVFVLSAANTRHQPLNDANMIVRSFYAKRRKLLAYMGTHTKLSISE